MLKINLVRLGDISGHFIFSVVPINLTQETIIANNLIVRLLVETAQSDCVVKIFSNQIICSDFVETYLQPPVIFQIELFSKLSSTFPAFPGSVFVLLLIITVLFSLVCTRFNNYVSLFH